MQETEINLVSRQIISNSYNLFSKIDRPNGAIAKCLKAYTGGKD